MAKSDSTPLKASDPKPEYKGLKDIKEIAIQKDSIRLSGDGYFYTLQGEGPSIGQPAVFVRLHHCNLACTWCDAYYTWDKTSEEYWTESWSSTFQDIADDLEALWKARAYLFKTERRVIWTGGEPLMQKKQIDAVMNLLWSEPYFWHPEIETNGTIMPTELQLRNYQFNVSPKLSNSKNAVNKMVKPRVIKALNDANSTFKFVCDKEEDLYEIEDTYGDLIDHDKIIIMPEGVTEEVISKHAKDLLEPCKRRAWRMTPRFQAIFAHGAERGV